MFQPEQRRWQGKGNLPAWPVSTGIEPTKTSFGLQEAPMTKTTIALAAALLAGTTLTSAANAGGVRVGFGFPLGSFVAHSNQSYAGGGYDPNCAKERRARRSYQAKAAPVRQLKRAKKIDVASVKPVSAPAVKTAKLEDTPKNDPVTKTNSATTSDVTTGSTTPTSPAPATTTTDTAKTETKAHTIAAVEKTPSEKAEVKKAEIETKQICRRYSAAIAGLVDVPCNQ
jgi:hypothetical protein